MQRPGSNLDWPASRQFASVPPGHVSATNTLLGKRHRSMTPNLPPSSRAAVIGDSTTPNLGPMIKHAQYHPYASPNVLLSDFAAPNAADNRSQPYHRSTSLDPAAFQSRPSSYPDSSVNGHTSQGTMDFSGFAHPIDQSGYINRPLSGESSTKEAFEESRSGDCA